MPRLVCAANIYQRHVVLDGGGTGARRRASDGLTCRVIRRGRESARTTDPQANTGQWVGIVRHVADVLAAFGEQLRSGEIIITGSVVPPLTIEPGEDAIAFEVDPVASVTGSFFPVNSRHERHAPARPKRSRGRSDAHPLDGAGTR